MLNLNLFIIFELNLFNNVIYKIQKQIIMCNVKFKPEILKRFISKQENANLYDFLP